MLALPSMCINEERAVHWNVKTAFSFYPIIDSNLKIYLYLHNIPQTGVYPLQECEQTWQDHVIQNSSTKVFYLPPNNRT